MRKLKRGLEHGLSYSCHGGGIHRLCLVRAVLLAAATVLCGTLARADQDAQPERNDDEKKLGERLIRKAVTDTDEDMMSTIIRLMGESAHKLDVEFDAGEQTQALQQRIMDQLDHAVKVAAQQTRRVPSTPRPTEGDKRKREDGADRPQDAETDGQDQAGREASSQGSEASPATSAVGAGEDEFGARRAWGHLPPRERDEVIQGIGEEFLERYRVWIERYYRALQETTE